MNFVRHVGDDERGPHLELSLARVDGAGRREDEGRAEAEQPAAAVRRREELELRPVAEVGRAGVGAGGGLVRDAVVDLDHGARDQVDVLGQADRHHGLEVQVVVPAVVRQLEVVELKLQGPEVRDRVGQLLGELVGRLRGFGRGRRGRLGRVRCSPRGRAERDRGRPRGTRPRGAARQESSGVIHDRGSFPECPKSSVAGLRGRGRRCSRRRWRRPREGTTSRWRRSTPCR